MFANMVGSKHTKICVNFLLELGINYVVDSIGRQLRLPMGEAKLHELNQVNLPTELIMECYVICIYYPKNSRIFQINNSDNTL